MTIVSLEDCNVELSQMLYGYLDRWSLLVDDC